MNTGDAIGLIFIIIIIIIVVGIVLWRHFFDRGSPAGGPCNSNQDCDAGLYCGGGNICVTGEHGKSEGAICNQNSDCIVGLACFGTPVKRCVRLLQ